MMGGFDKRILTQSKTEIRQEICRLLPLVEEGGYIGFCDHLVPPDEVAIARKAALVRAADEAARAAGAEVAQAKNAFAVGDDDNVDITLDVGEDLVQTGHLDQGVGQPIVGPVVVQLRRVLGQRLVDGSACLGERTTGDVGAGRRHGLVRRRCCPGRAESASIRQYSPATA